MAASVLTLSRRQRVCDVYQAKHAPLLILLLSPVSNKSENLGLFLSHFLALCRNRQTLQMASFRAGEPTYVLDWFTQDALTHMVNYLTNENPSSSQENEILLEQLRSLQSGGTSELSPVCFQLSIAYGDEQRSGGSHFIFSWNQFLQLILSFVAEVNETDHIDTHIGIKVEALGRAAEADVLRQMAQVIRFVGRSIKVPLVSFSRHLAQHYNPTSEIQAPSMRKDHTNNSYLLRDSQMAVEAIVSILDDRSVYPPTISANEVCGRICSSLPQKIEVVFDPGMETFSLETSALLEILFGIMTGQNKEPPSKKALRLCSCRVRASDIGGIIAYARQANPEKSTLRSQRLYDRLSLPREDRSRYRGSSEQNKRHPKQDRDSSHRRNSSGKTVKIPVNSSLWYFLT